MTQQSPAVAGADAPVDRAQHAAPASIEVDAVKLDTETLQRHGNAAPREYEAPTLLEMGSDLFFWRRAELNKK
jgi:hypothetical protein